MNMTEIYNKADNTDKTYNMVDRPKHYADSSIECIDAMEAAYGTEAVMWFCACNAFKYQWRFKKKNGLEDLRKSQWYQNKYIELSNKIEMLSYTE
jgi:hypothetical protein